MWVQGLSWKGCVPAGSSGDSDTWGGSLVVPSAHSDAAPARSCPHQQHLSASFGAPQEVKAVLCVL